MSSIHTCKMGNTVLNFSLITKKKLLIYFHQIHKKNTFFKNHRLTYCLVVIESLRSFMFS